MRSIVVASLALIVSIGGYSQGQDESSHKIEGGGISVSGWSGKVDPTEEAAGSTVKDAKFAAEGNGFHVTTGPAITYWKSGSTESGNYTVKATFTEPKYMNLNTHPHPYGLVIAGNDMGTAQQSFLYCAAYGSGTFIVRGFGPEPFQMNGRRGEPNAAVHKAAGPGEPVTQDISMTVNNGKVTCNINGTDVASYDKSAVVTAGKLKSTDGAVGLRFAHNTDVIVSGFSVSKLP
jgi:hypothetical protein